MNRYIAIVSVGAALVAGSGIAVAQESGPVINADGSAVSSRAGVNPVADASGPDVVYGDLNPGPGTTIYGPPLEAAPVTAPEPIPVAAPDTVGNVTANNGNAAALGPGNASAAPGSVTSGSSGVALLGPDGTYSVSDAPPSNVTVGNSGALAPVYEPAPELAPEPVAETTAVEPVAAEPVAADTAVATETDLDGDNYIDALEWDLGLDGNNPDSDADGVADGDELNIYGTEPTLFDTDGDGISDGEELFGIMTNPLLWDTDGDGVGDGQTVVV